MRALRISRAAVAATRGPYWSEAASTRGSPNIEEAVYDVHTVAQVVELLRYEFYRKLAEISRSPDLGRSFRTNATVTAEFEKTTGGGHAAAELFHCNYKTTVHGEVDIGEFVRVTESLANTPESYIGGVTGSGWRILRIRRLRVRSNRFNMRTPRGYVKLPAPFNNSKKGVISIWN